MKEHFLYDYCLLRMPALPVESALRLNELLNNAGSDYTNADTQLRLKELFSDQLFREAIYLGSKDLYEALADWLNDKQANSKRTEKLLKSLHRYYSRMCTRSTPYGLFAGCASGAITADATDIRFAPQKAGRQVRFDMSFITALSKQVSEIPAVQAQLKFYVNNTLYKIGDRYIYVEYSMVNGRRVHTLSALTVSVYIARVLQRAAQGATMEQLTAAVGLDDAGGEALMAFIRDLVQAQVLVSEFLPAVTGDEFIVRLIRRLKELEQTGDIAETIEKAYRLLHAENSGIEALREAQQIGRRLVPAPGIEILQTDLFYDLQAKNLNRHVVEEIARNSGMLQSLIPVSTPPDLEEFKKRFSARYEEQEVPLVQALDPDAGVGYGLAVNGNVEHMPLIDGVSVRAGGEEIALTRATSLNRLVTRKTAEFLRNKTAVIYISDTDVREVLEDKKAPASKTTSVYIFGSILAGSAADLDQGNYKFYPTQLHSPQAGKLFARFAYADVQMQQKWLSSMNDEQAANPDAILAEVVYVPEGHAANLTLRPQLRTYEIPYLCQASAADKDRIDINHLLVSVKNGRVVLRSALHNKEVFPQITHTHNYMLGQPFYRFLGDVQLQQVLMNFSWPWGIFSEEIFLPRVEYNKIILSRARWYLKKSVFEKLPGREKEGWLQVMCQRHHIPRYVLFSQGGDNELFLDLENEFCRQHILQEIKKRDVFLYEFLHMPGNCFIKDEAGSYANEVIIPMGTRQPFFPGNPFQQAQAAAVSPPALTRSFAPGSEWLYIKIYGGTKSLENILVNVIKPFAEAALADNAIDQWFFIRYSDPDIHVRVRFHKAGNEAAWLAIAQAINREINPFIESGQVSRIVTDTYIREIERYGEQTMLCGERLFFADSVATTCFLDMISGREGERLRWLMGLYSIDRLLNDFEYDLQDKQQLMQDLRGFFFREFSGSNSKDALRLELSLSDKYRRHSAEIARVLSGADGPDEFAEVKECFIQRTILHEAGIRAIKDILSGQPSPQQALNRLLPSYIHMAMNRLFLARQRAHELVIYHYLDRYYTSAIAREKQGSVRNQSITQ